ncbi:mitochondrial ribosomal protein subunit L20-domain-containing protein [Xylariaceae sp. FL1272]|nr:mitochondrial ribosomal protein subunit L20-domain-containing protein [Xylariaceae sp. FL1272]
METRQLIKPLSGLSLTMTLTRSTASKTICSSGASRRHQSTTSRTKKALKIPPHPDFLTPQSGANHIIYNPPPSAPTVYHTPFKFLPKSDPRRQANLVAHLRSAISSTSAQAIPPPINAAELRQKQYNVTKEQVEEMRKLRTENPAKWSVLKLAKKYECTPMFIMMCVHAPMEHRQKEYERKDAIKARWGPVRTKAREERKKRKELLLSGGL